jgi:1-acyl-sn-glycerol-3-phosphate acyltransferase
MRYLFSLYLWIVAFLYFVLFLIFALCVSFIFIPSTYDPWLKKFLRNLFRILHIPVLIEGSEKIKNDKTYLFMSNHVSLFDIPLLGGFVPGLVRGVEADRQHRWPLYGWVMGRLGNIPIERENIYGSIKSMSRTERSINDGTSIILLPEGHRTLNGQLNPFKKLPFHFAKKIDKELIPIGLSGLYTLKRKGSWRIKPTPIKLKFGEIISRDEINKMTTVELRDYVKEKIRDLIEES